MKKLLTLVLMAALLISCFGVSALAEEKIVVNIWHARGTGTQEDRLLESIEMFNSTIGAEEGIEVVATYQGGYGDVLTKTLAAISAGGADWGPYVQAILGVIMIVLAVVLAIEGIITIAKQKKAAKA